MKALCLTAKLIWFHNSKIEVEFKERCLKQDKPAFTHSNVLNLFIVYELLTWSKDLSTELVACFLQL